MDPSPSNYQLVAKPIPIKPTQAAYLGECPLYDGKKSLFWLDLQKSATDLRGSLHRLDLDTLLDEHYLLPGRAGFICFSDKVSALTISIEKRLYSLCLESHKLNALTNTIEADLPTIINDGHRSSEGIFFGTKDPECKAPYGALYLLSANDNQIYKLKGAMTCSNGIDTICFEGKTFVIHTDSPTREIIVYELATDHRSVLSEYVLYKFAEADGMPDGLCFSPTREHVVVALYNPNQNVSKGKIVFINFKTSKIERECLLEKAPRVTCPAFTDKFLIATTAFENMSDNDLEQNSNSGHLFYTEI